ncbi:MAG: DUF1192 domain-containing protein [Pseudomonadota bacterium]
MDEFEPGTAPVLDLERLSEDELRERIATLSAEIAACEAELKRKQDHKSAADALFGGANASTSR